MNMLPTLICFRRAAPLDLLQQDRDIICLHLLLLPFDGSNLNCSSTALPLSLGREYNYNISRHDDLSIQE
jgi:hypothetical protein